MVKDMTAINTVNFDIRTRIEFFQIPLQDYIGYFEDRLYDGKITVDFPKGSGFYIDSDYYDFRQNVWVFVERVDTYFHRIDCFINDFS